MGKQGTGREKIMRSLQHYISESKYSQKEIAEKLGVSRSSVTNWLEGKNSPDVELVMPICELLNITIEQFYGVEEVTLDEKYTEKAPLYSSEAMQLAQDYDEKLDAWGRKQVRSTADLEIARCMELAHGPAEKNSVPRPPSKFRVS